MTRNKSVIRLRIKHEIEAVTPSFRFSMKSMKTQSNTRSEGESESQVIFIFFSIPRLVPLEVKIFNIVYDMCLSTIIISIII